MKFTDRPDAAERRYLWLAGLNHAPPIPEIIHDMPMVDHFIDTYSGNWEYYYRIAYRRWMRTLLAERQNHRCCYCGDPMNMKIHPQDPKCVTLEHVVRKVDGGDDEDENLVVACSLCNSRRHGVDAYVYAASFGPGSSDCKSARLKSGRSDTRNVPRAPQYGRRRKFPFPLPPHWLHQRG